ncbi:hypothetical protein F4680DRAFT_409203 [Xylaria scruposa]|nr:hypothetical protein F4680DRAFT_409203 [Xylaria scruposa]
MFLQNHSRLSNGYTSIVCMIPERFSAAALDADCVWSKRSFSLGRKVTWPIGNQASKKSRLGLCQNAC